MVSSNFTFLEEEYPILYNIGQSAEYHLHNDAVTCLFKIRLFGEKLTEILFEEHQLELPYNNDFHNKLKTLEFEKILPSSVKDLLFNIKSKGNKAVHEHKGTVEEGKYALFSAFKLAKWFYETYSSKNKDITSIKFHVPENVDARHALHELENRYKELEARLNQVLTERPIANLPEEKQKEIQERSIKAAKKIEMSEAETRELIDAQLRQAGWEADTLRLNFKVNKTKPERNRKIAIAEWPVDGKWADYALFIGLEFYGIVEAKRYVQDISTDLRQSKIYSRLAEEKHQAKLMGIWEEFRVPFLFSTNGRPYLEQIKTKSGIWFLDIRSTYNKSRPLQGWPSPEGLKKLFEQDLASANQKLSNTSLDFLQNPKALGLRDYQIKAIKAVEETLLAEPDRRRVLIAMATGTGKTRTVIGLCYHLIKSNRFNRILFLVDRTLLGEQAINAFKDNKIIDLNTISNIYDVKELEDIKPDIDTRLHFATVQGMVKRLFYSEGNDVPSVDRYDCIVIDEAHRGYILDKELSEEDLEFKDQMDYVSKYRKVLDYFDAFSIGLTATPALHTNAIFGAPIYIYSYREAVLDGFLIDHEPPFIIKTRLNEEGVTWERGEKPKALDKENNSIIELGELEDELNIDVAGFNKLVLTPSFNRTVVKELVKLLDPDGKEKTLIFAATDEHADTIVEYLKEEFEAIGADVPDKMIQKITGKSYDPELQVREFKNEAYPKIVVTVDLLTTGIDVPAICNLVFLRRVKSRILYEQMLGRATRKCDEINKEIFRIYDAVGIYATLKDYTQMRPVVANPKATFMELAEELKQIDNAERVRKQIDQIIAKIQRKKKSLDDQEEIFKYHSGNKEPEELIEYLNSSPLEEATEEVFKRTGLWRFLDELRPVPGYTLWSDHEDDYRGMERGYGKGQKPEDYLESFAAFIEENKNKIEALNIICTRPKELDRKSLRTLMLELSEKGFNEPSLKAAWKEAKNEDIAADIISFIRTLAVGNALLSHEERIRNAIKKVKEGGNWNAIQLAWLNRFELQLLKENVLQEKDLNEEPFSNDGGLVRLNKIFNNKITEVINSINDNLYNQSA